jgi:DNA polymerase I-like protein with 3'-5' exonuclease and polymerase domains
MIFAMGPTVVKSLGIKFRKYATVQGQFIPINIRGREAFVYPSLSKRQMVAKTGYIEVLKQHIQAFLEGVVDLYADRAIQVRPPLEELTKNYIFPKTLAHLGKAIDEILVYAEPGKNPDHNILALDTETNTKFPHRKKLKLLSISVAWAQGRAMSVLVEHPAAPWTLEEIRPYLARLFQSPQPKVFHNGQYDLKVLSRKGFSVRKFSWDTMAGEHLLAEDKRGFYGLKVLTKMMAPQYAGYEEQVQDIVHGAEAQSLSKQLKIEAEQPKLKGAAKKMAEDDGFASVPVENLLVYGAIDPDVTRIICGKQRERMAQENVKYRKSQRVVSRSPKFVEHSKARTSIPEPLSHLMFNHIVPAIRVLASMEAYGFAVDREYLDTLAVQMDNSMAKSGTQLMTMILPGTLSPGEVFNPNSTAHLRKVLFGAGFLHPETGKGVSYAGRVEPVLTKTGQQTTNAAFLRSLVTQQDCPFSRELLQYRAMAKARGTFIENIRSLSAEDGRLHTSFHITGTGTGRLCVAKDTRLDTTEGSFEISKLDLTKTPNISIITHKNRYRKILGVYFKGWEEMYCVKLTNGQKIKVTRNHRFLTPTGIKHLKELEVGDYVSTRENITTAYSGRNYHIRNGFSETLFTQTPEHRRFSKPRRFVQDSQQFCAALPQRLRKRNTRPETPHILHGPKREHPWKERTTSNRHPQREAPRTHLCGLQHPRYIKTIANKYVVCSTKHEKIFYRKDRTTSLPYVGFRQGISLTTRTILPGTERKRKDVLRRPPWFLSETLYSFCRNCTPPVVCERTGARTQSLAGVRKSSQRPSLLEFEPTRNSIIHGTTRLKYPAYSPLRLLQKLSSRLCVPSFETLGRNRRQFSSTKRNEKTRPEKATRSFSPRVSYPSFHYTGYRRKIAVSSRTDMQGIGKISTITPVGVDEVWDIQVEEDHTYVAHGFVNHNSSSDENMQNIPEFIGKHNIKKAFVPTDPDDQVICNADAKAAEVRVYAGYSRDPNLIVALNDGLDPHSYFSSVGYNIDTVLAGVPEELHKSTLALIGIDDLHAWSYDDFEKSDFLIGSPEIPGPDSAYGKRLSKLRKNMKRVVFGILYGAGKRKIAEIVGISLEQAQTLIDILFRMFPTIPLYISMTQEQINYFGILETFFGRRRRLDLRGLTPSLKNSAYRKGVNFNIQSTSSDIVMSVLCDIDQAIRDLGGRMLITVHDSLVFEVSKKYITQLPDLIEEYGVKRVAKRYPWLPVPFKWDIKVGPSYGETMLIPKYLKDHTPVVTQADQDAFIEHEIRSEFEELAK